MKPQFIAFATLNSLLHAIFTYYIITFNIIYEKSSRSWIEGAVLSLFLDWFVLEVGTQLVHGGIRSLAQKFPQARYK